MNRNYESFNMWQNFYDFRDREHERRDMEYIKRMYPSQLRDIQHGVEEECDKLEYDGSMMFDEYPDRLMVQLLEKKIAGNCKTEENEVWILHVVPVMLYSEMYRRRSRRRNHMKNRNMWTGYSER